jgi:hypothetical protein
MNKTLILIVGLLLSFSILHCDMGIFDLQAVCKVTLKSGEVVNGFTIMGNGGYLSKYDTNGFIWYGKKQRYDMLFKMSFYGINFETQERLRRDDSVPISKKEKDMQVYYLKDISSSKHYRHNNVEIVEETDSLTYLSRDFVYHNDYELLDYIPIYTDVPKDLYLDYYGEEYLMKIPIDTISKFEIIRDPSDNILTKIRSLELSKLEEGKKQQPIGDGFYAPIWFHNVYNDKDFRKMFKKWYP